MRERLQTLLPSVLALTVVTLLYAPITSLASSGLPATITMYPETAGPGEVVEVTGLDLPGGAVVELRLTTAAGSTMLASATTGTGGDLREIVTLPADVPGGLWELQARASDGSVASYAFDTSGMTPVAIVASEEVAQSAAATMAAGNSSSDVVVLLVIAVVLGGVAIGGMFAWRMVGEDGPQPGMGAGADLIWSGSSTKETPELTATEEPFWKAAKSET